MSLVNRVPLSCPEVNGLICPYTGKPLAVVASICNGVATYNAPAAFSLGKPVASAELLYRRASMRNGLYGNVSMDEAVYDAYTGEELELVRTDDGKFYFTGGFDPTRPCFSLSEFVRKASCGKRDLDAPPQATSVEHVGDMTPDDSDSAHKVVDDLTEEAAQKIVDAIPGANKGRTVTGYRGGKKR